jgi:hypothetical protein
MIDERELARHPIVPESVQHNARVSPPSLSPLPPHPLLTSTPDPLQHPLPNRIPLRGRGRHARARILPGIHLLRARHGGGVGVDFPAESAWGRGELFLPARVGVVGGGFVWGIDEFCVDVDVVLWVM